MTTYQNIVEIFDLVVEYIILFVDIVGIAVLMFSVIRAVIALIRRHDRVRLDLAEGIAMALEFKLGGELLRTVIVREWQELLILGSVLLLHGAMIFLIQWEIRLEKKNAEERLARKQAAANEETKE